MTLAKDNNTYMGNPLLKGANVAQNFTKEQLEEYVKCSENPVYFIEKYVTIVNVDQGKIPFVPYDFQKKIIETIHENRFTICRLPRQSGKSTTVGAYFLHYILFNSNVNCAILANKLQLAKEILDRIKKAYELLPKWLQQGVVEWNKFSIQLENGSKIMSSSTSASNVRGQTLNAVLLDEFAFVPPNIADDFFMSVYPTISSGKSTKVIIVSTPKGLNHYYRMWKDAIEKRSNYIPIAIRWDEVPGRDAHFKEETMKALGGSEQRWLQEYECVDPSTMIEIMDKETKQIHKISIQDFFDFCCDEC